MTRSSERLQGFVEGRKEESSRYATLLLLAESSSMLASGTCSRAQPDRSSAWLLCSPDKAAMRAMHALGKLAQAVSFGSNRKCSKARYSAVRTVH